MASKMPRYCHNLSSCTFALWAGAIAIWGSKSSLRKPIIAFLRFPESVVQRFSSTYFFMIRIPAANGRSFMMSDIANYRLTIYCFLVYKYKP